MSSEQAASQDPVAAEGNAIGKSKGNTMKGEHSDIAALEEAAAPMEGNVKDMPPAKANKVDANNSESVATNKIKTMKEKPEGKPEGTGAKKPGSKASTKLAAKDKGKGKAIENDEDISDGAASDELIHPQGNPNSDPDDSDPDALADVIFSSEYHLSLRITTPDDEAAYKALFPYLAYGFTTVKTTCSRHNCGFHALKSSFNAARKRYGGTPTILKHWQDWFKSPEYERAARRYAQTVEEIEDAAIEERVDALKRQKGNGRLDMAQMNCLLRVANINEKVQFQLGVIKSAYRGKWNHDTKYIDPSFVKQAELVIAEKTLLARPVLWVYDTNEDEKLASHLEEGENPKGSPSHSHWEVFADPPRRIDDDSKTRVARVEQFRVGGRVETDMNAGLWSISSTSKSREKDNKKRDDESNDKGDEAMDEETDEEEDWGIGTSLQGEEKLGAPSSRGFPTEVLDGTAPNGKQGEFKIRELAKINSNKNMLSAKTDKKWASNKKKSAPVPKPTNDEGQQVELAPAPEVPEPTNDEEQRVKSAPAPETANDEDQQVPKIARDHNFFRVVPATTRTGDVSKKTDQVAKHISNFRPDNGEVVLDTGDRGTHFNMSTAKVIRPNSNEGWMYLRRLQPLERAFGFSERLSTLEPWVDLSEDASKTGLDKLRAVYDSIRDPPLGASGTFNRLGIIRKLNKEETARRTGLEVGKLKKNVTKRVTTAAGGKNVQFDKGEYVLLVKEWEGNVRKKHTARDFEGRKAVIDDKDMGPILRNAWGLVLRKDADDDDEDVRPNAKAKIASAQGAKAGKANTKKKGADPDPDPTQGPQGPTSTNTKARPNDTDPDPAPISKAKGAKAAKTHTKKKVADPNPDPAQAPKAKSGAPAKGANPTKANAQKKVVEPQPQVQAATEKRKAPGESGYEVAGEDAGPAPKRPRQIKEGKEEREGNEEKKKAG